MLRVVSASLLVLAAAPALAAEQLAAGPAPAWVKPVEATPPPLGDAGPPVRLLLQDRQLHFGPEGDSEFIEILAQIRTPQGLPAMGSLSIAWNPDTDTVTVNRARLIRGGQTIDLLAKQSFTVIRREANLERAIVDGLLTGTLQPEGVEVGDVVDLAYTVVHADPVLHGHADRITAMPPMVRADRLHLRATWDAKRAIQWRAGEGLDAPKVTRGKDGVALEIDMKDPPDPKLVTGAPLRYFPLRDFEATDFKDWTEVSALMAPLFAKAAELGPDSPLKAEAAKIKAAASDPKVQAAMALRLTEDQIRYLAIVLNQGGYIPARADDTWARRYGDCKAKTVMLLALLHELGVQAEPALVSATRGDGLNERLPAVTAFDHVIVRATIDGKVYWLDGTRLGDRSLDAMRPPPFQWALPLRDKGAGLIAIEQPPLDTPDRSVTIKVDASAGLDAPAPAHGEMMLSAARAAFVTYSLANRTAAEREKALKVLWTSYPWIDIKTISTAEDPQTGATRVVIDGTATLPFGRSAAGGREFRINGGDLGYLRTYERDKDEPHQDAPFVVEGYPGYATYTLSVVLPRNGDGFSFDAPDLSTEAAGEAFTRKARIEKGVATLETSRRTLVRELKAADAAKANKTLEEMKTQRVALVAPPGYRPTDKDLAALQARSPTTAAEYIDRGDRFMLDGKNALAMADFDKAVALDPKSANAYAARALGHIYGGRLPAAKVDIARAQELDPRNYVALHAVGMVAMGESRYADAAAAFGRAADIHEGDTFALNAQAGAYMAMQDTDKALAALAELERVAPKAADAMPLQRYRVYAAAGDNERALGELDKALAKKPDDATLVLYRAAALSHAGRRDEAEAAYARAIALKPGVDVYLARARFRRPDQAEARLADLDAAEKLEPGQPDIAVTRAAVLAQARRYDEAIAALEPALKAHPENDEVLRLTRAEIYARAGRTAQAAKDFADVRAKAGGVAELLNGVCWEQAIRGFALEAALADCDAALKIAPNNPNANDSRGFVLLRLGRLPEALAQYDAAVKLRPHQAESLFGRGLVKLGLGRTAEGQADLAAARAADAEVDAQFEDYGLRPTALPPTKTAAAAQPGG